MNKYKGLKEFKELKKNLLKDKKVKAAYEELEPEFSIIKEIIRQRIQKGVTQTELAHKIGTKQAAISRFESGRYNPTLTFLRKVSHALGKEIKVTVK